MLIVLMLEFHLSSFIITVLSVLFQPGVYSLITFYLISAFLQTNFAVKELARALSLLAYDRLLLVELVWAILRALGFSRKIQYSNSYGYCFQAHRTQRHY